MAQHLPNFLTELMATGGTPKPQRTLAAMGYLDLHNEDSCNVACFSRLRGPSSSLSVLVKNARIPQPTSIQQQPQPPRLMKMTHFHWLVLTSHFQRLVKTSHFHRLVLKSNFHWLVLTSHFHWLVLMSHFQQHLLT